MAVLMSSPLFAEADATRNIDLITVGDFVNQFQLQWVLKDDYWWHGTGRNASMADYLHNHSLFTIRDLQIHNHCVTAASS